MNNKIALGTVQFGLNYGINNSIGIPTISEISEIFKMANFAGIPFDTDDIVSIANKYKLFVVDDVGQEIESYIKKNKAIKVPIGFQYNLLENTERIGVNEIQSLIIKYVDSDFRI
jgi:hypothetical protein